jgi:hypothetical protein
VPVLSRLGDQAAGAVLQHADPRGEDPPLLQSTMQREVREKPEQVPRGDDMSDATADQVQAAAPRVEPTIVERVQTGVRLEKRLLKVLKALAEYHDLSLGDLLEGIVLHAFDGKCPFGAESLRRIADIKRIYGLDLDSNASHRLIERGESGEPSSSSMNATKSRGS